MKASREQLQELHGLLAEALRKYLNETPTHKIRATMLDVIRAFVKDNGVVKDVATHREVTEALEAIADVSVPFLPDRLN